MENIQTRELQSEEERQGASRSRIYSLLADVFRYPDESFGTQVREGDFEQALEVLAGDLPYSFPFKEEWKGCVQAIAGIGDEELEVEFVRLFEAGAGGPPCPLIEGSYREDRKVVLKELILFYNHFGLSYAEGDQSERPDHLCLEMEFLHYLTFKEVHALQAGADPSSYRRAQRDFLKRHLLDWIAQAGERIDRIKLKLPEDACREVIVFYSSLIDLLLQFLDADYNYLQKTLEN